MADITRQFTSGKMNKSFDERVVPNGEYIDAMNIRMGSTEKSEIGVIENTKGNLPLTSLRYIDGTQLSTEAKCIGALQDPSTDTLYWFVHDPNFPVGATGKLDLIVSYNVYANTLTYHVISIDDGGGVDTTLNFNTKYTITGVNKIQDLLFFTDDYNAPRVINVTRGYANPVADIDQFSAESIMVIKAPPIESPTIQLVKTNTESTFLIENIVSFAYRYRYADGEYSATSQWSDIAFDPGPFGFEPDSYLNEGMVNQYNTAIINYNSGNELVVGIDLLFKHSDGNVIRIIEKLDKKELGIPDNSVQQYTFSDSKIFTILPESELLRLYDNVPRYAKAQTIMGNRLMYGNYVEGYDLIDKFGNPIKLDYYTRLISEDLGIQTIPSIIPQNGTGYSNNYSLKPGLITDVEYSAFFIDLTGVMLLAGSSITFDISFEHAMFNGDGPYPTETTPATNVTFSITLQSSYASAYELANSNEFKNAIGTALNIKPVYDPIGETSCDGFTFTDYVNCAIPSTLGPLYKISSGINTLGEGMAIYSSIYSQSIGIQIIAMKYVDNLASPVQEMYEYYRFNSVTATYQKISSNRSLHSNRGYEVGIVYMDEFNRASTALVSDDNTVPVACSLSFNKNSIQVTIPTSQRAPYWAKRYKFVIKPDEENYETIYSSVYFPDPESANWYFLLEGESAQKVKTGDRLIVKNDSNGPVTKCAYATVLEKDVKSSNFLDIQDPNFPSDPTKKIPVPSGVYMKLYPSEFVVTFDPNNVNDLGTSTASAPKGDYAILSYTMSAFRGAGYDPVHTSYEYADIPVPAGSKIYMDIDWNRTGRNDACEKRGYLLNKVYTSTADYSTLQDWFNGDNIADTLNTGFQKDGQTNVEYISTTGPLTTVDMVTMYMQFDRDTTTNKLVLQMSTGKSCTGWGDYGRHYTVTARFRILSAEPALIFETEPQQANPDIFFENNLSFAIDADGNHMGNVQDQDIAANLPGRVDTGFFNCFAFGNGVESYKIRDSISGTAFNLGERVTSVSAQDYKMADRFADITYSGVYNPESNLNKLNEFNLGLLNYKYLESSFGEIYILDGRETDVLTLQEDKISYVLAGKNLLSDATAGGAITSVPEVLGTQIARVEKYGISFNPESYTHWGSSRYFTDTKRGVVIEISGDSYSSDQLKIVSEMGMRTWFRDLFNSSYNTQKLGAFDPYMNEYVLSSNDEKLPDNPQCIQCGISKTFTLDASGSPYCYCIDLGPNVGATTIDWSVVSNTGGSFYLSFTYNGTTYSTPPQTGSGSYTFNKDSITEETIEICVYQTSGTIVLSIDAKCPVYNILKIVEVVVTNNVDSGSTIHTEFRYTNGSYVGALSSNLVIFSSGLTNPLVSRYNIISGPAGSATFPPPGSIMRLQTNKIPPDDYNFMPLNNKFRYFRSNVLYNNTPPEIADLINVSNIASPIGNSGDIYYADFTVPSSGAGEYLYLIWDLRNSTSTQLCYSDPATTADPVADSCCNCNPCDSSCITLLLINDEKYETSEIVFHDGECGNTKEYTVDLYPNQMKYICINNSSNYEVTIGSITVITYACGCNIPCQEDCWMYAYLNPHYSAGPVEYQYVDCDGRIAYKLINPGEVQYMPCIIGTIPTYYGGVNAGKLVKVKDCGYCVVAKGDCVKWVVKNVTSTAVVSSTCDGYNEITVAVGEEGYLCSIYPEIPLLLSGSADIEILNPCICL